MRPKAVSLPKYHQNFYSSISLKMSSSQSPLPSGRPTRVYNTQEREVIDPFRDQYMDAGSPAARKTIAMIHIFPALFNYWASIGKVFDDRELALRSTV
jgi:hypothetical protein